MFSVAEGSIFGERNPVQSVAAYTEGGLQNQWHRAGIHFVDTGLRPQTFMSQAWDEHGYLTGKLQAYHRNIYFPC